MMRVLSPFICMILAATLMWPQIIILPKKKAGGEPQEIAYVNVTTGVTDSSSGTVTATAANHTSGNLLVAYIVTESEALTVSSVTDTAENTWESDASCKIATANFRAEIWWAKNIIGNASNVVVGNFSSAGDYKRIVVAQFSGASTSAPWEACATGSATTGTTVTSGSFSPTGSANSNFYGVTAYNSVTWTPATNYTEIADEVGTNTAAAYRLNAPSGAQTVTAEYSTSNFAMVIVVASFKP